MLVLSRKLDESIFIGGNIEVVILEVRGGVVRIGIKAPREVPIVRGEIPRRVMAAGAQQVPTETLATVAMRSSSPETEQRSSQLLHSFCERRKAWRTPNIEPSSPAITVTEQGVLSYG